MAKIPRQVVAKTCFTLNDRDSLWYWKTKALDNEVVASGEEGYHSLNEAITAFFTSQGVKYSDDHWPGGYVFMELSDKFLQINKLTK